MGNDLKHPHLPRYQGQPLKFRSAQIDDSIPSADLGKLSPGGFKVKATASETKDTVKTATLDFSSESLSAVDSAGKVTVLVPPDAKGLAENEGYFHDTFDTMAPEDIGDSAAWEFNRTFQGSGALGKSVSVTENLEYYMGGMHPETGSTFETFNVETGKQLKLTDLLTKKQFQGVVAEVEKRLPELTRTDDGETIEGSLYKPAAFTKVAQTQLSDHAALAKTVNENFLLSKGEDGKEVITVGWGGAHVLGGMRARFEFEAPKDASFKAKVGIGDEATNSAIAQMQAATESGRPDAIAAAVERADQVAKSIVFNPDSKRAVIDFGLLMNLRLKAQASSGGDSSGGLAISTPSDVADSLDNLKRSTPQKVKAATVQKALTALKTANGDETNAILDSLPGALAKLEPKQN